jgi:hypothetical protein
MNVQHRTLNIEYSECGDSNAKCGVSNSECGMRNSEAEPATRQPANANVKMARLPRMWMVMGTTRFFSFS